MPVQELAAPQISTYLDAQNQLDKNALSNQKSYEETRQEHFKTAKGILDQTNSLLANVTDQNTYTQARNVAVSKLGFDPNDIPEQYDPAFVNKARADSLLMTKQLAAGMGLLDGSNIPGNTLGATTARALYKDWSNKNPNATEEQKKEAQAQALVAANKMNATNNYGVQKYDNSFFENPAPTNQPPAQQPSVSPLSQTLGVGNPSPQGVPNFPQGDILAGDNGQLPDMPQGNGMVQTPPGPVPSPQLPPQVAAQTQQYQQPFAGPNLNTTIQPRSSLVQQNLDARKAAAQNAADIGVRKAGQEDNVKSYNKSADDIISQIQSTNRSQQSLESAMEVFNTANPGSFAQWRTNALNVANSIGIPLSEAQRTEMASAQTMDKAFGPLLQGISNQFKGNRTLVAEIDSAKKQLPTLTISPQAGKLISTILNNAFIMQKNQLLDQGSAVQRGLAKFNSNREDFDQVLGQNEPQQYVHLISNDQDVGKFPPGTRVLDLRTGKTGITH